MVEPRLQPRASEDTADAEGSEWSRRCRIQQDEPKEPGAKLAQSLKGVCNRLCSLFWGVVAWMWVGLVGMRQ